MRDKKFMSIAEFSEINSKYCQGCGEWIGSGKCEKCSTSKVKDTCRWEVSSNTLEGGVWHMPSCYHKSIQIYKDWKYCPYCGKEIEDSIERSS
jgi:hypothetical protein